MRRRVLSGVLIAALLLPLTAWARDAQFTTTDGVRLHIIEAGPATARTIVFVPGWTMPAWIFQAQMQYFATQYHVVALDPRGQGSSEIAPSGYGQNRRGQDIAELIAALGRASCPVPRTFWRDAIYSVRRPILYVVRPRLSGQAANLAARDPYAETALFATAGHALFVDEAARFNLLMADFIRRRVWPS